MLRSMKKLLPNPTLNKRFLTIAVSIAAFLCLVGFAGFKASQTSVSFSADGKKEKLRTNADTVEELLEEQHIKVKDQDYLSHKLSTHLKEGMNVSWIPSRPIQLTIDDKKEKVWTTADTVEGLLKQEGIKLNEHDQVSPSLKKGIEKNDQVQINKAFQFTFNYKGETKKVWSTSTTVADFLAHHKIQKDDMDQVNPSLSTKVEPGMNVTYTDIEKVTDVVEEPVNHAVVKKEDPTLPKGQEKVLKEGQDGVVKKEYEITKENGQNVSKELLTEEPLKEKQDRVIAVGAKVDKPVSQTAGVVNVSSKGQSGKEITVSATAYTASCNGCSGTTANGMNLKANPNAKVIAVDPNVIPLGSKVYVEGYGYATAADTGGAIKGHRIDVFFADKSQAYKWGRRNITVRVVN
ncbi:G5 and 3D domain-containing protein [Priestia endophytica]|uniref:G5 and 3D domain-containing protein n=1 Tax=Priestia endophytica TaxID=135735 RepID=UPI00227F0164|nr:G5 and 3D domain-containing protein [Priestia endophytica]MCY8233832.1 ubiquitin-like domain-containing protein [Priestia endophytica]